MIVKILTPSGTLHEMNFFEHALSMMGVTKLDDHNYLKVGPKQR